MQLILRPSGAEYIGACFSHFGVLASLPSIIMSTIVSRGRNLQAAPIISWIKLMTRDRDAEREMKLAKKEALAMEAAGEVVSDEILRKMNPITHDPSISYCTPFSNCLRKPLPEEHVRLCVMLCTWSKHIAHHSHLKVVEIFLLMWRFQLLFHRMNKCTPLFHRLQAPKQYAQLCVRNYFCF